MAPEGIHGVVAATEFFVGNEPVDGIVTVTANHDPTVHVLSVNVALKPPIFVQCHRYQVVKRQPSLTCTEHTAPVAIP